MICLCARSLLRFPVLLLGTLLFLSFCMTSTATAEDKPDTHQHQTTPPKQAPEEIGLDEQLGSKIPLEALFRDESGKAVRLNELITGPTIILPVYYSCTNVCNYMQGGLARILASLKNSPGSDYRIISISFDSTETPEQAARIRKMYRTAINAPFPEDGWYFLTGDAKNIKFFTDSIGYRFKQKGRDFIHPVASLIVSGDGAIVRYLYGTSFLPKDLSLALLEARDGKIGKTIRKVVDYCFTFDPTGKTYVFNILRISATVVILCAGSFLLYLVLTGRKRREVKTEEK